MMCCIIAAYLFAQMVAMLRRWGIYWGLVRRRPGEEHLPSFIRNLAGSGPRPAMSTIAVTVMVVGMAAGWAGGAFERPPAASANASEMPRLSALFGL